MGRFAYSTLLTKKVDATVSKGGVVRSKLSKRTPVFVWGVEVRGVGCCVGALWAWCSVLCAVCIPGPAPSAPPPPLYSPFLSMALPPLQHTDYQHQPGKTRLKGG